MLLKHIYHYFLIKKSGYFDSNYYLINNPDVRQADVDPLWHFVSIGWEEGRNPSNEFNTSLYLNLYPDVECENVNPLAHYIKHGQFENRLLVPSNLDDLIFTFKNPSSENVYRHTAENPPRKMDFIIFPIIDWTFRFQRPQQIALQLAKMGHRIFYIKTSFCHGYLPKIKELRPNIYSVQLSSGNLQSKFNTSLSNDEVVNIIASFKFLRNQFAINATTMIVDLPYWVELANNLKKKFGWRLVYDCMDLHKGFSNHSIQANEDEDNLIINSDLVIVTSHYLLKHIRKLTTNYVLVPNGTDYEFFHKAKSVIPADEIDHITPPIIGYYGAIADWFDTDLVGELAKDHPEWSFLLIGSTYLANLKPFADLRNIYLLGEKPYNEIPKFLSHFDVSIIPFKSTPLTNATNPVKMYEYLSAGKPVIATQLDELSHHTEFVTLAESKQSWEKAITDSLAEEKTTELLNKRYNFAQANTWKERADIVAERSQDLFPLVSIVIISYNNLPLLKICLESIQKNTAYPRYEIIIVDNSSDENTVNYLKEFERVNDQVNVIYNKDNLGFAKANNQGAEIANGEYLVLLNNDTIVTPGWIHRMLWHLEENPTAGAVGPVTNSIGNEAKIDVSYHNNNIGEINKFAINRSTNHFGQSFEIKVLALYCCMISKNLYDQVEGLDERYEIGMFEDDDLAMKLKQRGFSLICIEDVFIHHFHGASFKKLKPLEYQDLFEKNKKKYEEKWGITWKPHRYRER